MESALVALENATRTSVMMKAFLKKGNMLLPMEWAYKPLVYRGGIGVGDSSGGVLVGSKPLELCLVMLKA